MSKLFVIESKHEQCPACHFPTRYDDSAPAEHDMEAGIPVQYVCDERPAIRTHFMTDISFKPTITHFEFTCPRCSFSWYESPSEHGVDNEHIN